VKWLLVFDLDGTLIDSRADLASAVNQVREEMGVAPLMLERVTSFIGDGIVKLVERSFTDVDVDFDQVLERYRMVYQEQSVVHTTLYAGVREGLERLTNAGMVCAVLTNKPGDVSRAILKRLELSAWLHGVVGAEDGFALKPSPEGLISLTERYGVEVDDCWMVGDHHTDLLAGEAAGVRTAFAAYGFGTTGGVKPTAHFASFSEGVEYFLRS
jgi:phosphoglycolate phosphatase